MTDVRESPGYDQWPGGKRKRSQGTEGPITSGQSDQDRVQADGSFPKRTRANHTAKQYNGEETDITMLRHESPNVSSPTLSDQQSLKARYSQYSTPAYETSLANRRSYMIESESGVEISNKDGCQALLALDQTTPQKTLFNDRHFKIACETFRDRNENKVILNIYRLLVPSTEALHAPVPRHLQHLIERFNEEWTNSIPYYGPRPQPEFAVGFRRSAFNDDQLKKLAIFVGEGIGFCSSYFMATSQMFFPFLTCEVTRGALDIADRKNAHSMTMAVRGVVALFQKVKRANELDRQILAFSVSHDHNMVRIYGHYAAITENDVKFYRHPIKVDFSFSAGQGREKWTAYRFIRNVYNIWMPIHLKTIRSAIDHLPGNGNVGIAFATLIKLECGNDHNSDLPTAQEMERCESTSQGTIRSGKPTDAANVALMRQNERLHERLKEQDDNFTYLRNELIAKQEVQMKLHSEEIGQKFEQQREETEWEKQKSWNLEWQFHLLWRELHEQKEKLEKEIDELRSQLQSKAK